MPNKRLYNNLFLPFRNSDDESKALLDGKSMTRGNTTVENIRTNSLFTFQTLLVITSGIKIMINDVIDILVYYLWQIFIYK